MGYFLQLLLNGVHSGALFALLSYGYVLTYLVTKRANIAHGAIFAFTGQMLTLGTNFAYNSLWIILPLAIALGGLIAVCAALVVLSLLAFKIFPRLIVRSPNTMITASLAVCIILMEGVRIASGGHDYWLPPVIADQINLAIGSLHGSLTRIQIFNSAIIFITIAACEWNLAHTLWGHRIRAVADDPLAANLCAINVSETISVTIIAGGLFAIIGGLLATLYYGNMSFDAGPTYGLKVLFIASAGGFSRPLYAAFGAFIFGISENLWDGYFPIMWREAVFYCLLAAMLCMRIEGRIDVNARN